jgi:uncharacterized protein YkwD
MSTRSGLAWAIALLLAATACSVPSSPDPANVPPSNEPPAVTAAALVELTNSERSRAGLPVYSLSQGLMQAAQLQADQIATGGRLDHMLPDARYPRLEDRLAAAGYSWQAAAENLAGGQRTASLAMDAWMQSSGHRDNILSSLFSEFGTAYIVSPSGQQIYVQVFGRPR